MNQVLAQTTVNIVILDGEIFVEDRSVDPDDVALACASDRPFRFIDAQHFRRFVDYGDKCAMAWFTGWLLEQGAVVDKCWILGPELSDQERKT